MGNSCAAAGDAPTIVAGSVLPSLVWRQGIRPTFAAPAGRQHTACAPQLVPIETVSIARVLASGISCIPSQTGSVQQCEENEVKT